MKTLKYKISIVMALVLGALSFSCIDEDFQKDGFRGDGKTVYLSISAPKNEVINPFTKSAQDESQSVSNLSIFVFDTDSSLITSKPLSSGLDKLGNTEGASVSASIEVGNDAKGFVCVVANAGDLTGVGSFSDLRNRRFPLDANGNPLKIMYASPVSFNVNDATCKVESMLKRIYSMVTVVVNSKTTDGVIVTPKTLTLHNAPKSGQLVDNNLIMKEDESLKNAETLTVGVAEPAKSWDISNHDKGGVLYLYENTQPEGYCQTRASDGKKDQTSKTPKAFGEAITSTDLLMTDYRSSYIEIKADYKKNDRTGIITYRFFLGKDAYTNFDVTRNVHYKITLTLEGNGGVDEATWRVETENIPYQLNLSDVYVGYRLGSSIEMIVTGDVDGLDEKLGPGAVEILNLTGPNTNHGGFTYKWEKVTGTDGKKSIIVTIKASATNVHDYKMKQADVVFHMGDGTTQKAVVRQVPRLVDPIAYYKKAENDSETPVVVKYFDSEKRSYEVISSKGPWSVTIGGSSEGYQGSDSWFEIYTDDGKSRAVAIGDVITGEGPVQFKYKPKSKNTSDDNTSTIDKARFGVIVVKYHNKSCAHEIYLRQGYGLITFNSDANTAWSSYNCIGKDENGNPLMTTSPTQTGWLLKGGVDYGMNPYSPGYEVFPGDKGIEYSDKTFRTFVGQVKSGSGSSLVGQESDKKWLEDDNPQGPCPTGYIVPNSYTYDKITENTSIYTGFIHDDDSVGNDPASKGWEYVKEGNGRSVRLYENNHCNPAKGILFIENGIGSGLGSKHLFFNFGKGVFTEQYRADKTLIDEVGVGQRMGGLGNNHGRLNRGGYGAFYWGATSFDGTNNGHGASGNSNFGKVDFAYDIFSATPHLIDVPGTETVPGSGTWCIGIAPVYNGSFVRCVKDMRPPVIYMQIVVKGSFVRPFGGGVEYLPTFKLSVSLDKAGKNVVGSVLNPQNGDPLAMFDKKDKKAEHLLIPEGTTQLYINNGATGTTVFSIEELKADTKKYFKD